MEDSSSLSGQAMPERLGPYVIERPIGAGGMGTVYLGKDERDGREAAVKVLPPALSREGALLARFRREIESLSRLANPHVVELYDFGTEGELHFYAMEYVAGETLADRIRRDGRIPWREAIEIAVQVCSALKSAHDAGVIHRDLKPSNLMLGPDGVVKLTDFGVAQLFAGTRLTKTGGVIGTVEYMSPEQAKGGRVTKRSDLYSLGAVLYVMLTGRPPFLGKSSLEVLQKQQHARFDRAVLYAPDIPHWLDELVSNLLEKDPDKRVPDAYVLSRRLQSIAARVDRSLQEETVDVRDRRELAEGDTLIAQTHVGDGPGVSTLMRNVVRDELTAAAEPGLIGRVFNNTWVLVGLLAALILGGVWWFQSRSLTPEQKFEAGVALMDEPEGAGWTKARDEFFKPLLEDDRDTWEPKVAPYLRKVRLYELRKAVSKNQRRGRLERPDSEPERFLFLAVQHREMGELGRAERILKSLTVLTAGDPKQEAVHSLAVEMLKDVRSERDAQHRASSLAAGAFRRAAKHLTAGEPDKARAIWTSIVELYGGNPSAQADVSRARKLLADNPPKAKASP